MFSLKTIFLAGTAGAAMAFSGSAYAQDAAAPETGRAGGLGDEIIVTARRTGESIQRTPVSVQAFSGETLARQGVSNLQDVQRSTTSLQVQTPNVSPAGLFLSMRGQVAAGTGSFDTSSVGVYLDDVFNGSSQLSGGLLNFDDLERVEVLKGPQGTLYGRNVTGGVVKFVTRKPSNDFEGQMKAGIGNYDRRHISGMINVPIVDGRLAVRVVGGLEDHSGYSYDVRSRRDLDDLHKWNVRASVKANPTDNLEIIVTGWYGKYRGNGPDTRVTYVQPGINTFSMNYIVAEGINGITAANLAPLIFGSAGGFTPAQQGAAAGLVLGALPTVNQRIQDQLNAPRNRAEQNPLYPQSGRAEARGAVLTVAQHFGTVELKSITAYDYGSRSSFFNVGGGSSIPIYTNQQGSNDQFTQELQLNGTAMDNRLKFALGAYYLNSTLRDARRDSSIDGAFPLFLGQKGLGLTNGSTQTNRLKVESKAVYGQATFGITDSINFTGGLRYTDESSQLRYYAIQLPSLSNGLRTVCIGAAPTNAATPLAQCEQESAKFSNHNLSYTAGLDWSITPDILVYGKVSRGFKSGGVSAYTAAGAPFTTYRPEVNVDYEAGFKSEFLDRRVRLNASYYHTDYSNIQRTTAFEVKPGLIATATRNAADATIDGVEAELAVVPVEGLTLGGTFAYTKPKYGTYLIASPTFPGGFRDASGQAFQGLAKYTYSVNAAYTISLKDADVTASVNWAHRSSAVLYVDDSQPSVLGGPSASDAVNTQRGYGLLSASLSVELPKHNVTLSIWGKNVLNKRYYEAIISLVNSGVGSGWATFGAPATVGADVTFRF
ncbi:TonB-dependent receptor [Rhizorhabdus argentea]|uniref:TonB-dependent receptor n=1 Tax=Rhizorhabdus argentea TaxID=1387174 RepID=UPI0030ECE320